MDSDNELSGADILNELLSNSDTEESKSTQTKTIKELDFNFVDSVSDNTSQKKLDISNSNGNKDKSKDTANIYQDFKYNDDSSDEEDKRNFEEQRYSESGREINALLKQHDANKDNAVSSYERDSKSLAVTKSAKNGNNVNSQILFSKDVYSDPFFGIRIINPLISSSQFKERMTGKTAISISKIKVSILSGTLCNDWVIAGVLINKSPTKTSQKGSAYCIWKLSDLSDSMNAVALFLFSGAYKSFWKTTLGTVVGILNPNIMETKDDKDQATLSVDTPQKIMIIGKSKDMGKCKSTRKDGEPCTAIVNLSRCEYCVYHVKQEYKKCSKRAELSNTTARGFSSDILNNRAQRNMQTFNKGLQNFVPVHALENQRLRAHDQKRLALLSQGNQISHEKLQEDVNKLDAKKGSISVECEFNQAQKDLEKINKLRGWSTGKQLVLQNSNTDSLKNTIEKSKELNSSVASLSSPRLGIGCTNGKIDFSQPITRKHINMAKINALRWVQQNGQFKRKDPNRVGLEKEEKNLKCVKRPRETEEDEKEKQSVKKSNCLSEEFKKLMETKSAHTDLIEKSYDEEKEKYFNKLEIKEKMEKKMLSTYKIQCKAVKCLKCKYTAFSSSDLCKEQKHPIRVIDAVKRFFKCQDCGNRTVSLERLPLHSCKKCNSSNWTRAAMMDERRTKVNGTTLSLRGDEEKFLGSATNSANLNLLVPEVD